jgi:hypothetical protein
MDPEHNQFNLGNKSLISATLAGQILEYIHVILGMEAASSPQTLVPSSKLLAISSPNTLIQNII